MCLACFHVVCSGATGCEAERQGWSPAVGPGMAVNDYTALLAYLDDEPARWNARLPQVGAQVFVSFSFTEAADLPDPSVYAPYDATDYWSFDATQRDSARAAMAELSRVAGVTFVETTGEEAMIRLFGASGSSYGGWANYPWVQGGGTDSGRLVIDQEGSFAPGTSAFQVLLHELGHAVGLKHPFSGSLTLPEDLDNTSQTLMSYTWQGGPRSVFSPLDVQAMQHLYGAARDNAGWDWAMDAEGQFRLTAAGGDDVLIGLRTANILRGQGGNDQLVGAQADDTLFGGSGRDTLDAGDGANRVLGGSGRDSLTGGDDDDRLFGGTGDDSLEGGWNDDRLWGDDGNDVLHGDLAEGGGWGADRLWGGARDDTLYGLGDSDVIRGDADNDRIYGGASADTLYGGTGDDEIEGGTGSNVLFGDAGNDTIHGGDQGHMRLSGGAGDDLLMGESAGATFGGWDTITGGTGNDTVYGGAGSDSLLAGSGADSAYGGIGWDTIDGGRGHDRLWGEADNDSLTGGAGDDTLDGGAGQDVLFGGTGDDSLLAGDGTDTLWGGAGRDTLSGGLGTDYFRFDADAIGWTDTVTDFEVDVDRIMLTGLGFTRASLSIADAGNGRDAILTAGDGGVFTLRLAGVGAAGFDMFDVIV